MHGFEVFDALHTHCEFHQIGKPYFHNCKIDDKELRICCYGECPIMKEFLKDKSVRANATSFIIA